MLGEEKTLEKELNEEKPPELDEKVMTELNEGTAELAEEEELETAELEEEGMETAELE